MPEGIVFRLSARSRAPLDSDIESAQAALVARPANATFLTLPQQAINHPTLEKL
jgi:hypothetical protein